MSLRVPQIGRWHLLKWKKIASSVFGADRVFEISDLSQALDKAVKDSIRPLSEETVGIIVTGSVVTVGQARSYLRKKFAQ